MNKAKNEAECEAESGGNLVGDTVGGVVGMGAAFELRSRGAYELRLRSASRKAETADINVITKPERERERYNCEEQYEGAVL